MPRVPTVIRVFAKILEPGYSTGAERIACGPRRAAMRPNIPRTLETDMKENKRTALVQILSLAAAGTMAFGCSSSTTSTGTGGSGGNHATGAGGTGAGGSGTGPTAGAGGSGTVAACAAAPSSGLIADFMGDGGIEIVGGLSTYPSGSTAIPAYTAGNGSLMITENAADSTKIQYVGTVLFFNNCVDASAFSGVQFTLSGSFTGCTIQYSTNDEQHDDMTTDPKGTCTLGTMCYSPQAQITAVTTTDTVIMEPFITTPGGDPLAATDPTKLTGIQWQFTIPAAADGGTSSAADGGASSCMANLTIKDVKFYH
jgi:hypothetical protein